MPFFGKLRSNKQNDGLSENRSEIPKQEPYKHIPVHAARDARSQVPPSARESDRQAIAEHHKRRNQMPQRYSPVLRMDTSWSVGQRDVPYIGKEKQLQKFQRPTATLKELNNLNNQRKIHISRRAAYVEPIADVSYHLGLVPLPLALSAPPVETPDMPSIPLPTRIRPPMPWLGSNLQGSRYGRDYPRENDTAADVSALATMSTSSSSCSGSISTKSRASSTSSSEPLDPPPARSRARDSMSRKIIQDSRFYNPNSSGGKRLRAASHDSTGIEQAMASPESFRPHRSPPTIVPKDSARPTLPMAGFQFGTERPYSPHRLRPWLTNTKHTFQSMTSVDAV